MSAVLPFGGASVMQQRREPPDSLDFFPTPLWATRALVEKVLRPEYAHFTDSVWEPACGEGHMSKVLEEYFSRVEVSDVFPYGEGEVIDFLSPDAECWAPDWIITNPPFKTAEDFALRGLERADIGVALLVRSSWLEGTGRYARIFRPHPPKIIAQFTERVPMVKGRYDPNASTATSYAWVVWIKGHTGRPAFHWIPPCRRELEREADADLAVRATAPLLEARS